MVFEVKFIEIKFSVGCMVMYGLAVMLSISKQTTIKNINKNRKYVHSTSQKDLP